MQSTFEALYKKIPFCKKNKSSSDAVKTTHLPKQLALKMDEATATRAYSLLETIVETVSK